MYPTAPPTRPAAPAGVREDSGSLRSTFQLRLPAMVLEGVRRADTAAYTVSQRLDARLQLGEGLCRLLVALLDEERRALGLTAPPALVELLDRIDKPTAGMWWQAAISLEQRLSGRADRLLPQLIPGGVEGELSQALCALRAIRNRRAHDGELHSRPDQDAFASFAESRGPFRSLLQQLGPLCAVVLLVATEHQRDIEGGAETAVLGFRGDHPASARLRLPGGLLLPGEPALLTPAGHLLPMRRWIAACPRFKRLLLVHSWHRSAPRWADFDGRPVEDRDVLSVASSAGPAPWFADRPTPPPPRAPQALIAAMRSGDTDEHAPQIPGLRPLRSIGAGGNGVVWLVLADEFGARPLALKLLQSRLVNDHEARERFEREQRSHDGLRLRGVVEVYRSGCDPVAGPWILMEHLEGGSLAAHLAQHGPLSPAETLDLLLPLLDALHRVHERGVIHRDLKPSNILLDGHLQPRLIDFGVARQDRDAPLTRSGELLGTLIYGAPEQLAGGEVDRRADLYSVGQIALEALCGVDREAMARRQALPSALRRALLRCIELDPQHRPTTAAALAEELREALHADPADCALSVGDRLSGEERLSRIVGEASAGIFLVETDEPGAEAGAALVPAGTPNAAALLQRLYDSSSPPLRRAVGLQRLRRVDGTPYIVLDAGLCLIDRQAWCARLNDLIQGLDDRTPANPSELHPIQQEPGPSRRPSPASTRDEPYPASPPTQPVLPLGPIHRQAVAAADVLVDPAEDLAGMVMSKSRSSRTKARVWPAARHALDQRHAKLLYFAALDDSLLFAGDRPRSFGPSEWERAIEHPFGGLALLLRLDKPNRGPVAAAFQRTATTLGLLRSLQHMLEALPPGEPSAQPSLGPFMTGVERLLAAMQPERAALERLPERSTPFMRQAGDQAQIWLGDTTFAWQVVKV